MSKNNVNISFEKIKLTNSFEFKEEDLNYLFEIVKFLYKKEAVDDNSNIIIDDNTKKPKLVDSLRRSGKPKYTHPYNVAVYLYKKGYSREYLITALFHDVLEDTKYTEEDIRKILQKYVKMYPNAINTDKQEFIDTVINAVNCVTKKGKISRPKAPKLRLKKPIVINNIEITEISFHEFLEKRQIVRTIGGQLERKKIDDLNLEDLTDESQVELEKYLKKLSSYRAKMPDYINGIKQFEIARIVKVADRISNLTDFSPTDDSNWLEKYIRETGEFFLELASGTNLEQDFINAIRLASQKKDEKKKQEEKQKSRAEDKIGQSKD